MMKRIWVWLIAASMLASLAMPTSLPARAGEFGQAASDWVATDHGAVRLISAVDAVGDGASVPVGLQFRMKPGWHIYWRSPGDAGYPPQVDWSASGNLSAARLYWPAPERFAVLDLQTVGYSDAVVLPIEVAPARPGEALRMRARVDYLTCADICVPYVADLALDLPAGAAIPSAGAHEIARARAAVPGPNGAGALTIDRVALADTPPPAGTAADGRAAGTEHATAPGQPAPLRLTIDLRASAPLADPDVFIESAEPLSFSAPSIEMASDRLTARLSVRVFASDELSGRLAGLPVTVTAVDGDRSVEAAMRIEVPLVTSGNAFGAGAGPAGAAASASPSLPLVLALAVLGGLILNAMPCVLPVLSMKLLAVIGHGGGERRAVRSGFVAAAAGILFSFIVLAAAVIGFRASGAAIGWGIHFQQPWFLTAMVFVVTLFAANLWGLYDVHLPRAFGIVGERSGQIRGLTGHFLTGALATLLATPCSAPFLGTAIGFALAGGPLETLVVFCAVGAGLALPYLAVAAFPSLATRLPKPGPWMKHLRRLLALALAGTAVWLLWVLSARTGAAGAWIVGGLAAAMVLLLAGRRRLPPRLQPAAVIAGLALVVAAIATPLTTPSGPAGSGPARSAASGGGHEVWAPFEPERIPGLVAKGRIVFVNVTADWCLTCKVNERVVLDRDPVRARLSAPTVVAMRADWTTPDDGIARYLARFGRYAIPFDAVYGPKNPDGEALPELLTQDLVLDAIGRAEGALASR